MVSLLALQYRSVLQQEDINIYKIGQKYLHMKKLLLRINRACRIEHFLMQRKIIEFFKLHWFANYILLYTLLSGALENFLPRQQV